MIGPRSRAVAAPQKMGKFYLAPGTGCDVRRKVSQTNEQSNIATLAWRPIALGEIGAGTTYKVRCDDLAFTLSGTEGRYYPS